MKVGQVSDPFETLNEKGKTVIKIVQLKAKNKAHSANLVDDYQMIMDYALNQKNQKTLNAWIVKKQENTYIHVIPSYRNCKFKHGIWLK